MRRTSTLGMMILTLALMVSRRGAAQVEEPVRCVTAAETVREGFPESERSRGGPLPRETRPSRTTELPRGSRGSKARRRPAGPLELPAELEKEAVEGLSLDAAIQRLLAANRDLAVKFQDIPKARADILSAGLIENPSVFLDSDGIPYGNYSPQRPGETSYEATFVQPFDVSGKRRQRLLVAHRAEKVMEALYQDAVRQEIDRLYSAYVDVLEAEIGQQVMRRAVTSLTAIVETTRGLAERGLRSPAEVTEATMRRANAEIALREAETTLLQARRELALLLALPAEQADGLAVRSSLRDRSPPLPCPDVLIQLALQTRPDLTAYQLSVERARADVQLSRAERLEDVLIFYTPYQGTTFPSQGQQTATGWETGGLSVLPVFDRNQGDIARGRANVTQLQIQVQGLREDIIYEVRRAIAEYTLSRQVVRKYESEILSNARRLREEKYRLFTAGQEKLDSFLTAERSYDEVAHQYLEALVHHRRNMLRLNTAVGQRIQP